MMLKIVEVKEGVLLKDYDLYSTLAMPLRELMQEAHTLVPAIQGRKVWMVNSTAQGGGVAEMMPRIISILRQSGIDADWVVAHTDIPEFYNLTKKIHNLIHGEQEPSLTASEKLLYERVNKEQAEELLKLIKAEDIVVIHDPQPMGMAVFMKEKVKAKFIWRCHIGFNRHTVHTGSAWEFLMPYADAFSTCIFSAPEYIPGYLTGKSVIMHPSIDPLDHKNRDLSLEKVVGILCNSNLITEYHPVLTPPFTEPAKRLQPDGTFQSPLRPTDMGLLFNPVILQISRWDRLKGFLSLMKAFVELKENIEFYAGGNDRNKRRLQLAQLIFAGPDPDFVEDDPEGKDTLGELVQEYISLPASIQPHIIILKLPMASRKENELIVNALQRVASVVVQNSLKEGFGLTVTEAMWKVKPVIGTNACGIRQQIRHSMDGLLTGDPLNTNEIAANINHALSNPKEREVWGYQGQKRVIENFLIFTQIRRWLQLFSPKKTV